jgi:hypothetical protein
MNGKGAIDGGIFALLWCRGEDFVDAENARKSPVRSVKRDVYSARTIR